MGLENALVTAEVIANSSAPQNETEPEPETILVIYNYTEFELVLKNI
jgi:hypothetical protein